MKISKIMTIQSLENLDFDGLSRPKYDFYRRGNFIFIVDWQSSFKWHQFQNDRTPKFIQKFWKFWNIFEIIYLLWLLNEVCGSLVEWSERWARRLKDPGSIPDGGKINFLVKKKKKKISWIIDKHTFLLRWQNSQVVWGQASYIEGPWFKTADSFAIFFLRNKK